MGVCGIMLGVVAALQVVFVFAIRGPYQKGMSWPVELFGALAFVTLISGYLPIPFELIKRRGRVQGISLVFLTVDCLGAFFSLMSLGRLYYCLKSVYRIHLPVEQWRKIPSILCLARYMHYGESSRISY